MCEKQLWTFLWICDEVNCIEQVHRNWSKGKTIKSLYYPYLRIGVAILEKFFLNYNAFTYAILGGINRKESHRDPNIWGHTFQLGSKSIIHHHDPFTFNKHLKLQISHPNSLLEWRGQPRGAAQGMLLRDVSHYVEGSAMTHTFLSWS